MSVLPRNLNRPAETQSRPLTTGWSLDTLLAILFIISLVSPLVGWVGRGLTFSWLVFVVWLFTVSFSKRLFWSRIVKHISRRRSEIGLFGIWLLFIFFNAMLGRGYTGMKHLLIMVTLGMGLFMEMIYTEEREESRKILQSVVVIIIGIEVTRSLPTLLAEPLLPRFLMAAGPDSSLFERAMLKSVGEYGFYTALAISIPMFFAVALERQGLVRLLMIALSIACGAAIVLAGFMGAILIMVTGLALLVLLSTTMGRSRLRSLSAFLMVAIIGVTLWYSVLGSTVAAEAFLNKFLAQSESIRDFGLLEGDQTNRADFWRMSAETFLQRPIFGIGPSSGADNPNLGVYVGGHSSWLDLPAEYGLLGFVFYAGSLFFVIRRVALYRRRDPSNLVGLARIVCCALFVLGGSYNPVAFTLQINMLFFVIVVAGAKVPAPKESEQRTRHLLRPVLIPVRRD